MSGCTLALIRSLSSVSDWPGILTWSLSGVLGVSGNNMLVWVRSINRVIWHSPSMVLGWIKKLRQSLNNLYTVLRCIRILMCSLCLDLFICPSLRWNHLLDCPLRAFFRSHDHNTHISQSDYYTPLGAKEKYDKGVCIGCCCDTGEKATECLES